MSILVEQKRFNPTPNLPECKAKVTGTFGNILKLDSIKKVKDLYTKYPILYSSLIMMMTLQDMHVHL